MAQKILIIEDEYDVIELIGYNLTKEGFTVLSATDGEQGVLMAKRYLPNLIILDLMLPGIDGLEVCRRLKNDAETSSIPIVMLTAKSEEADIVVGLELGADDYITKPFSPRVLVARIKAVLRRKHSSKDESKDVVQIHNIVIDKNKHLVLVDNKPVNLTATEFNILYLLASRPGWVFSRAQIVDATHGENYAVTERSIDVQIASLRKKLGIAGKFIETVRGVGYKLKEELPNE